MAAPRSLEEMNFMTDKAREMDDTGDYFVWIACNDREVEGTWECDGQEGREPFLEWDLASGQPDSNGNQDCGVLAERFNNKMDDLGCDSTYPIWLFACVELLAPTASSSSVTNASLPTPTAALTTQPAFSTTETRSLVTKHVAPVTRPASRCPDVTPSL
ncbi:uncharacterized protein LOC119720362 [Patiria miniata]|uniref:C-type lectin domain-containing protein n=1 Tax=Patiria miniata TaxID=46514 RepID=A0A913Z4M0_PATMI|nr:uncharacterized protein LOC119720362 [Patiria miniata]